VNEFVYSPRLEPDIENAGNHQASHSRVRNDAAWRKPEKHDRYRERAEPPKDEGPRFMMVARPEIQPKKRDGQKQ